MGKDACITRWALLACVVVGEGVRVLYAKMHLPPDADRRTWHGESALLDNLDSEKYFRLIVMLLPFQLDCC